MSRLNKNKIYLLKIKVRVNLKEMSCLPDEMSLSQSNDIISENSPLCCT